MHSATRNGVLRELALRSTFYMRNAAYGSYVVWGTKLRCRISETVVFSPKKEIMILIILTWVFEVFTV